MKSTSITLLLFILISINLLGLALAEGVENSCSDYRYPCITSLATNFPEPKIQSSITVLCDPFGKSGHICEYQDTGSVNIQCSEMVGGYLATYTMTITYTNGWGVLTGDNASKFNWSWKYNGQQVEKGSVHRDGFIVACKVGV